MNKGSVTPETQAIVDEWSAIHDVMAEAQFDLVEAPWWKHLFPSVMRKLHARYQALAQREHELWMKLMAHGVEMRRRNAK